MILIAYHIILFVFTRETSYVFYIAYMCGVLFYTATFNGFTAEYILPKGGMPLQYAMIFAIDLAFIGLVLFTRAFLNTPRTAQRFDIALRILTAYLLIVSASAIFANYLTVNIILSSSILPVVAICYSAAISVAWRLRSRQHLYFLVGSFWLMLAGCIASLMTMGILPNNSLTRNSVQIGAIIESVLFALPFRTDTKFCNRKKNAHKKKIFVSYGMPTNHSNLPWKSALPSYKKKMWT
jgi:hypothetical protein